MILFTTLIIFLKLGNNKRVWVGVVVVGWVVLCLLGLCLQVLGFGCFALVTSSLVNKSLPFQKKKKTNKQTCLHLLVQKIYIYNYVTATYSIIVCGLFSFWIRFFFSFLIQRTCWGWKLIILTCIGFLNFYILVLFVSALRERRKAKSTKIFGEKAGHVMTFDIYISHHQVHQNPSKSMT